jgi:hypothetical protein
MFTPSRDRMATKSRGARHQQNNILPGFPRERPTCPKTKPKIMRSCHSLLEIHAQLA